MLTNSEKKITVEQVQAELDAGIAVHRLWKRRMNALLGVLEAEAAGQLTLPFPEEDPAAEATKK